MLIATQGHSVNGTLNYFDQVLSQGDYYLGQEVAGSWNGKGAELLGLASGTTVTREQFKQLLLGNHPETGKQLVQRQRQDRRPGMDLTFSVPKSVSLAWAVNRDERIVEALQQAVRETMERDVEPLMHRRVRDGKHASTKQKTHTGKLIYADFLHKTSRPVSGKPDPHLHVHAFVINYTHDDGKHYAGEMEEIVRQRQSLQAKFESRLACKIQNELGYNVVQSRFTQGGKTKTGWEIEGITRKTIEKYSQRTQQVEAHALEHGITDAAKKAQLGKITREKKDPGKSVTELREEWTNRLSDDEKRRFAKLGKAKVRDDRDEGKRIHEALHYAVVHHLYRQSTVERHQVIGTALEQAITVSPEAVEAQLSRRHVIERNIDDNGSQRTFLTTKEVLKAEQEIIEFARDGRGSRKAIGRRSYEFDREWLNEGQKRAIIEVLLNRDAVMAISGGAGTGKSSLMQEASFAIRSYGKQVFAFAPSTGAKEVLEGNGFKNAQTVEHLIRNENLHSKLNNQVIWIDEAGLLDTRSMQAVFRIAKQENARVVLSGDTRQHSSPRRGEAMRLLEKEARIKVARVHSIQRQKGEYKRAVELISRGHDVVEPETGKSGLLAGFDLLDSMGKIQEISGEDRLQALTNSYLDNEAKNKSVLVVAPTHAEADAVTENIRSELRAQNKLGDQEQTITQLRSMNFTDAEKSQAASYRDLEGLVVQFHQNISGGIRRGQRYRVIGANQKEVRIRSDENGSTKSLPLEHADRFEVYSQSELTISSGDKVRFTLGGTDHTGKRRISNGRLDEVKSIDRQGNLVMESGIVIEPNHGHLDLGYVVTSHSSQGKDRQVAIAAMSTSSVAAINSKQFYVTVSRGSEDVQLFVDDKARIRRAIERTGEQLSATELVNTGALTEERKHRAEDLGLTLLYRRQHAARTFRERLSHWWQQSQDRMLERPLSGLYQDAAFGMPFTLSPGRSR